MKIFPIIRLWWDLETFRGVDGELAFLSFSKLICSKSTRSILVKFSHVVEGYTFPRQAETYQNRRCTILAKCGQVWHFSQCDVLNSRFFSIFEAHLLETCAGDFCQIFTHCTEVYRPSIRKDSSKRDVYISCKMRSTMALFAVWSAEFAFFSIFEADLLGMYTGDFCQIFTPCSRVVPYLDERRLIKIGSVSFSQNGIKYEKIWEKFENWSSKTLNRK